MLRVQQSGLEGVRGIEQCLEGVHHVVLGGDGAAEERIE
jgi:hypothetical protein